MTPIRLTQQFASFALATFVTLAVASGLNGLAAPDAAAVTQLVAAASAPRT